MNTYTTLLSLAIILFLSSSSLLARQIHPYEQYHEEVPDSELMLVAPTNGESIWYRYLPTPLHHISDERLRRGWGSGRRRRRRRQVIDYNY